MTVRKIVPKSQKSLQPTRAVADVNDVYVQMVIQDLKDTLKSQQFELDQQNPGKGGGVGLASNQIEFLVPDYPEDFVLPNIYVVNIRPERAAIENCDPIEMRAVINADFEPIDASNFTLYHEGCLSITGFTGFEVKRYQGIRLTGYDETGQRYEEEHHDFAARLHQHEIDHGKGGEYLNCMDLSINELQRIISWINLAKHMVVKDMPEWLVPDKLKCSNPATANLEALSTWVDNRLMAFLSQNTAAFFENNGPVDLANFAFNDIHVDAIIAEHISPTSKTKRLDLSGNLFTGAGLLKIAEAIKANSCLKVLNLQPNENCIADWVDAIAADMARNENSP